MSTAREQDQAGTGRLDISLAGWSLHRRFLREQDPLTLLDYPRVVRDEFGITKAELNSPFFAYIDPDIPAASPIRPGYLRELKRSADDAGVELVGIAVDDHGDLSSLSESARRQAVDNHRKWFDACLELGCSGFRANSGGHDEHLIRAHVEQCIQSFGRLAEWAAEAGIKIMMENHWGLSADPYRMVRVLRAVDSPSFGSLPDFGNFPPEIDRYHGLALIAPYAIFVHAKYTEFAANGEDPNIDSPRLMRIFEQAGYNGPFGIEFEGEGDDHEGVLKSKALIQRHAYLR